MSDAKTPPKPRPAGRSERVCPCKAKAVEDAIAKLDTRITIPASLVDTGIAYVRKRKGKK